MAEARGRILVVDPDPACLTPLAEKIEALGRQVVTATSGDDGLRKFWDFLPDLVFADALGLGEGGERMCSELKRTDYGVITPLVVHSPRHPTLTRVDVMRRFGAVDYIFKPIQETKVRALVDWVLEEREDSSQTIAHEVLDRFTLSAGSEGVVSLDSGSLPYLLGRAEEEKLGGLVLLTSGTHKNILVLEQGLIVAAASNAPAEQLERVLLAMRKLTPAQLAEVKGKVHRGTELFPLLSFLGLLKGDERREVLRYQALTIGVSMFRALTGLLQFRRGETIDCPRLEAGIRPTTLALIGLRRNPALLKTATERFVRDQVVFMPPSATTRQSSRTLPLTKFERTVLGSVNGERSVKELRELGRLAQIDLDQPLAVLVGSGILKPSTAQASGAGHERVGLPAEAGPVEAASGELKDRPFIDLVGKLLRDGATGMLTVDGVASRAFAFLDREIVYARSSRAEDSLGRLLVSDRLVSREALDRALAMQRQVPDRRLGSLLVEMHALSPDALYRSLRTQIIRILEDTFSWQYGQFSFVPSARPPEWSVRLDTEPVALLRHGAGKMSHRQLREYWSRTGTHLVAENEVADTTMLTIPERELLAEAAREGGVLLSTRDVGALRRAHLLVVAGFAHALGAPDPSAAGAPGEESLTDPTPTPTPNAVELPADSRSGAALPSNPGPVLARPAEVMFEIVHSPAVAPPPAAASADATGAIIAFLKEEILSEKRALDSRLRGAEVELRQAMEELGRLRERTRQLEAENRELRRAERLVPGAVAADATAAGGPASSLGEGPPAAADGGEVAAPVATLPAEAAAGHALAGASPATPLPATVENAMALPAAPPSPGKAKARAARKRRPAAAKSGAAKSGAAKSGAASGRRTGPTGRSRDAEVAEQAPAPVAQAAFSDPADAAATVRPAPDETAVR